MYQQLQYSKYTSYLNTSIYMVRGYIRINFVLLMIYMDNALSFINYLFGKGNSNTCIVVLVTLTNIYSCYIGS